MELSSTRQDAPSPPPDPSPLQISSPVVCPPHPPEISQRALVSPRRKKERHARALTLSRFKRKKAGGEKDKKANLSVSVEEEELAARAERYRAAKEAEHQAKWEALQAQIPTEDDQTDYGDALFYVPDLPRLISLQPGTNYYHIRAATKNKLVERMTALVPAFDNEYEEFLTVFFMTYRSFMTPVQLLTRLVRRYDGPEEFRDDPEEWLVPLTAIRRGVCFSIARWFTDHYRDFTGDPQLKKQLDLFLVKAQNAPRYKRDMVDYMTKVVREKSDKGTYQSFFEISIDPASCPDSIIPKDWATVTFLDLNELEIARQLTIEEFNIYAEIKPEELQGLAWSKGHLKHRAQNILQMIERVNHLSAACATLLLTEDRLKYRRKIAEKLLNIMSHLYDMNSFSMLRTMLSAFEQSSVHRLKWTFAELKPKYIELAQKFETLFQPQSSHKNLRKQLEQIVPPAIPFLGVYLTDLTFVEEGNAEEVEGNLINFKKKQLEYDIIVQVLKFQSTPYNFHLVPQIPRIIKQLPALPEPELWNLSLEVEPRGITSRKELKK